ncbi:MAG: hypothetical protein AMJ62_09675 [Myxococcales bacterium SG8_38]|nr:MAG: hypothetical protein AMJ62_09675 [Myxococcales bacterium SG8_38]
MTERAAAIERFVSLLEETRPAVGRVTLQEVAVETAPVLPLLEELPEAEPARWDLGSFAFRECFTVLTLVGRRLALLDLTPTSALQVVELALRATSGSDARWDETFARRAVAAAVEGFVMGREERVAQAAEERAARPLKPLPIDEDVFALFVSGVHDPQVLSECVDALGRAMLDAGAQTAIVDFTQLDEPTAERAAALLAADEVAHMLGGVCFFTGLDARWQAAAAKAHIELEGLHVVPRIAETLADLRSRKRLAMRQKKPSFWKMLLRRLRT